MNLTKSDEASASNEALNPFPSQLNIFSFGFAPMSYKPAKKSTYK